jgi:hypothetical protein
MLVFFLQKIWKNHTIGHKFSGNPWLYEVIITNSRNPRNVFLPNKIDEWMKKAEERPQSAVTTVRLIAKRLRELTERDEELLAETTAVKF